jgi:ABC-type taurine transport system ATPase subunit
MIALTRAAYTGPSKVQLLEDAPDVERLVALDVYKARRQERRVTFEHDHHGAMRHMGMDTPHAYEAVLGFRAMRADMVVALIEADCLDALDALGGRRVDELLLVVWREYGRDGLFAADTMRQHAGLL